MVILVNTVKEENFLTSSMELVTLYQKCFQEKLRFSQTNTVCGNSSSTVWYSSINLHNVKYRCAYRVCDSMLVVLSNFFLLYRTVPLPLPHTTLV
jgi:hypothetical protein